MAEEKTERKSGRTDLLSVVGVLIAVGGILGGLILEGGKVKDVAQLTAAIIVLGGTAGAVMISTPASTLRGGLRRLSGVVRDPSPPVEECIDEMVGFSTRARKKGIVSLEDEVGTLTDPFLKKALTMAVDGTDIQEIRSMLDLEIAMSEHHAEAEAKVFESAGGYAPTVGILGAVLGLIQVMKNLANIDEVGHGIAVAFVATVYGVGIANLLLLPAAAKIKARARAETQRKELILEGVCAIVEGMNPKLVRARLEAYAEPSPPKKWKSTAAAPVGDIAEA